MDAAATPAPTPDTDPVGVIEAALVRLVDDVGVLAEEDVVRAFSILKATDLPTYLRLRNAAVLSSLAFQEMRRGNAANEVAQQALAVHRVLADDVELLVGQPAGLVQHIQRHGGLAHVVQQRPGYAQIPLNLGQLHLFG